MDKGDVRIRPALYPFVLEVLLQFAQGGKGLARGRDELARIVADVTCFEGGAISGRELSAAGVADEP